MTAHPSEKPALPHTETGWAKARRRRGRGVRTCLPAILERGPAPQRGTACEENIVRGED
ncbi:hypothetical protein [Streptomyces sp. NPDC001851]|uniref:hypothetical protein n=1 Tax=Streptomyces sp. NPDC001851 TaxID=3154529 RepID=UPI003320F678